METQQLNQTCVRCGGRVKHYDKVDRIVRTKGGDKKIIKVPRLRCVDCKYLRRVLPEHICPYKHYESEIIQGVKEGLIFSDTLGFEDYPCEMTMVRWIRETDSQSA